MRQRNAGAHPLTVMTDPPRLVEPGEVIDFDEALAGFEPVDDDSDDESEQPSSPKDSKTTKSRKGKAASPAATDEEV